MRWLRVVVSYDIIVTMIKHFGGEKMHSAVYPVLGNETRLPFYLSGIGRTEPEFHVKRDKGLTSHQLLFTAKGSGVLRVGEKRYILEKNSLLYLPPALPHEYYPAQYDWTTCWMVFRGDKLADIMQNMGFEGEMIAAGADISAFQKIFERILSLASDNLHNSEKCSLLIYNAVLTAKGIFDGRSADGSTGSDIVDEAVRYINEHSGADITLGELSDLSGVSPQYFGRVFRQRLDMRPMEYVARVKVSKAKTMLLDSDIPVAELSQRLGYTSPTYFGIVFRKYEGVSPSEFRKNRGNII